MKKFCIFLMLLAVFFCKPTLAQYSAQKEEVYMATLKAVTDYKMDDEENIKDLDQLRENERFNKELHKMIEKLSNRRTKNSTNIRVYRILLQAGKELYRELN